MEAASEAAVSAVDTEAAVMEAAVDGNPAVVAEVS